jgi:hypothetical protein
MTKIIFYLTVFVLLLVSKLQAQDSNHKGEHAKQSFEAQVESISSNIENITKEEKSALKIEVEAINVELQNGKITKEQADKEKRKLAENRAKNIEVRVAVEQQKLGDLVQQKVDGKIAIVKEDSIEKAIKIKFYYGKKEIKENIKRKDSIRLIKLEKRKTSQIVLAGGFNNLITNNKLAHSDFYYLRSGFFEWGFTYNYRLFKDNNLFHLKYGITGVYNELYPTQNRYFVRDGKETKLESYPIDLNENKSYFKNVYVTIPVFLELDFSKKQEKNGLPFLKSQQGFRFGIGGFVGFQTNSKQFLRYEVDGLAIKERQKGNFNTNDFIYGVSTYLGYKATSLYLKYDLNPLFENNVVDQNNISLGVRFDFN